MKWPNIKLIYSRELRDQLRDRRTLFTVAIMPMLLYPFMGMAMLQVGQFMRQQPTRIWLVDADNLPAIPPILINGKINPELIDESSGSLIEFVHSAQHDREFRDIVDQYQKLAQLDGGSALGDKLVQMELARRGVDAALFIADPMGKRNAGSEAASADSNGIAANAGNPPEVFLFLNSTNEKSRVGAERVGQILSNWKQQNLQQLLRDNNLSPSLIDGVSISQADVASKEVVKAAMWSKVLPFIVVIWALTGAFYPAIDLCAGEKERGTFETLLSSPAARSEIAIGKLLTVMTFSYATSALNLASMAFTGLFVANKLGSGMGMPGAQMGMPPVESFFWLLLALIPISAFFSAIALAAAAFARSSKEGQYYLVPLMMVSMPLMIIPTLPGSQLDFGTSLIPISGLIMLLKGLIEGHYSQITPFVGPVCIVTLACCWFSIKWVISQFNSESVLFRPSEQFSLSLWFKSLIRERENLPTLGNAVLCVVVILLAKFFLGFAGFVPNGFGDFAIQVVITLVASIAVPALLMALILTRSPRKSLRLDLCSVPMASAAILAAIFLNPIFAWISSAVIYVYPPTANLQMFGELANRILADSPGFWATLLVFAIAPAIVEELGFRGFVLTGMESLKNKWQAILITSICFGLTHSVIHQSVVTFFVGIVLGIIAIQTGSLIPCILFHAVHNAMALMLTKLNPEAVNGSPVLERMFEAVDGASYQYNTSVGIAMTGLGIALIAWFLMLPKTGMINDNQAALSEEKSVKSAVAPTAN